MTPIQECIVNKKTNVKPIWLMRQAGRYLPEFRLIREKNPDFIKLCLNSKLSSEITLQPVKRFNLDAAIIFSDILMVPYGLGQKVKFEKNKGPILSKFNINKFLNVKEHEFLNKLNPIYNAIKETRRKLSKNKPTIIFLLIMALTNLIHFDLQLKVEHKTLIFITNLTKFKDSK